MNLFENFFAYYLALWLLPVALAISYNFYHRSFRPRLIPKRRIKKLAQRLIARRGISALELALQKENHAFRTSSRYKQGLWRRIRIEIERQLGLENRR